MWIEALPETAALCILPWWLSYTRLVQLVLQYADKVLVLKLALFDTALYISVSNGVSAERRSCSVCRLLMQRAVLAMQTEAWDLAVTSENKIFFSKITLT